MATVTRENIGILHEKLTINITPADYSPAYKKGLAKAAASANIAGFRKGMVPTAVINKLYGEKIIADEVLKTTEKELQAYFEKENIHTIANPLPLSNNFNNIDIKNLKEYEFVFEVGIKPEVIINPTDIKVKRYVIDVTDKMLDEQVEKMQLQGGPMTEPETVATDEDVLNVIFTEVDADGNVIDGGLEKPTNLYVKHFEAEFKKSLFGLKKEDSVTTTIATAFDEKERGYVLEDLGLDKEDAENANKNFKITITNIGLQIKSELNEEFFKKMYPSKEITTEAELRATVKEEIAAYFAEEARRQMHDQIYHFLIDEVKMELPKDFLVKLLEQGDEKPRTKEEALEIYPTFESQMKWSLISEKIQKEENIKVFPDDIRNAAKAHLYRYLGGQVEMFGDDKFINDFAERMLKDKKFVDENYGKILADKLFASLEGKVSATEEGIDLESFSSKLHHHHY